MISEDCGVHSGVGERISYQSAEALTYTYCWAGLKEKNTIFYCIFSIVVGSWNVLGLNVTFTGTVQEKKEKNSLIFGLIALSN